MRKILILLAFVLTTGLLLTGCGGEKAPADQKAAAPDQKAAPQGKKVELNFVSNLMESHPTVVNSWKPWLKLLEDQSGGSLKMSLYNPNTLAPVKNVYDSVVSGSVDIGAIYAGYTPGKFPYLEVINLPMLFSTSEAGSLAAWDLYQKFPEWRDQFKDTKVLWHWVSAPVELHTTKKQVKTLEDLKGMKIIGWSASNLEIIKLLGANPIEMISTDTYLALERNMADGVMCPIAPVRSYKISDIAKYHTIVSIGVEPFAMAMNKDKYNNLSPEQKKIIDETTGAKMASSSGKSLDEGAAVETEWMQENGHTIYVLPPEERNRWIEAVKPRHEKWLKDMESKGFTKAREIYDEAVRLGQEYDKKLGKN
ncbi:MAG: TRAP transporter substrate-binding protein [Peptococcaceae bacterium]|nr:TRAP transporter substrate-binding protein [Peptococcaceae bacterium]